MVRELSLDYLLRCRVDPSLITEGAVGITSKRQPVERGRDDKTIVADQDLRMRVPETHEMELFVSGGERLQFLQGPHLAVLVQSREPFLNPVAYVDFNAALQGSLHSLHKEAAHDRRSHPGRNDQQTLFALEQSAVQQFRMLRHRY